jgi:hypothetical protein
MPPYRRRFRIILPRVQLRLIGAMAAVAALALLLQYSLLVRSVLSLAQELPRDGAILIAQASSSLAWVLGLSLALLLPTLFVVAVLVSHRFCGPIYRFERYLADVISGKERGECRLRQGDDLIELCELINRATAAERARHEAETPASAGEGAVERETRGDSSSAPRDRRAA